MKRAYVGIRPQPVYRQEAFVEGLRACGYDVRLGPPTGPGAVFVGWNRYAENHDLATRFEKAGGVYICAENGYVGPGGISPHSMDPREWYAVAVGSHNGAGTWPVGGPERWEALGVELQPWRTDGEHILVCPNRSFGRPDLIMPLRWAESVKARLARVTKREIRIRPHPGNNPTQARPLAEDLRGAHACVIWSSSAGVQALIAGVPVICEAPHWIIHKSSLTREIDGGVPGQFGIERPVRGPRLPQFESLAWAQFHYREIATGEPIARMIEHATAAVAA